MAGLLRRLLTRLRARTTPPVVPLFVPPGHFYSPVVDPAELADRAEELFRADRPLPGIEMNEAAQCALAERMREPARALWFPDEPGTQARYFYRNDAFSYADGVTLGCLLQMLRPRRIIEVGSGYSSALMLDVVERCLDWSASLTCIDPHPARLASLLRPGDHAHVEIVAQPVQRVDLTLFDRLEAGDVLFIDSTHIVKTGSDVLHHFERVLPRLRPGVVVHLHDMFHPFEYPRPWVMDMNLSWNELYYVRAFLTGNAAYEVMFFVDFMAKRHAGLMRAVAPQFMQRGGSSLWLRKTDAGSGAEK